ncbi:MAG TPA: four helix bundle protein [Vicinamibacterales bacterium]|nr:four helix bundle protein [Vicinamibacterales bacterium]
MHPKTIALQARIQTFAAGVIKLCDTLAKDAGTQRIVSQLVDSSGGTDSNYRAACRARSKAEFIAKLGVAVEEADESKGWLQLLVESNRVTLDQAGPLIQEADELTAILVKSRKTAEQRKAEHDRHEKQLRGTLRRPR